MNPRLIILVVIAAGMAVYFASIKGGTQSTNTELTVTSDPKPFQGTIGNLELEGSEPPEKPNFSVQVEVDRSKGKNRLYFTVNESHGYYVEQFRVRFWHVKGGATDPEDSALNLTQFFDQYLPAKGTLRMCMEVVPAELARVGGDIGESKDWNAEIDWHGRARVQNPNPLPPRTDIVDCG